MMFKILLYRGMEFEPNGPYSKMFHNFASIIEASKS